MIRQQRAKQFQPFDAMKGLSQALRDREERHCREFKRELSEETIAKIQETLLKVKEGARARVEYYKEFHSAVKCGIISKINKTYKYIILDEEKIFLNDIYDIQITDFKNNLSNKLG